QENGVTARRGEQRHSKAPTSLPKYQTQPGGASLATPVGSTAKRSTSGRRLSIVNGACPRSAAWSLRCRLRARSHLGSGIQIKQKVSARQSRNHKQEVQSEPNGVSCTQRTLRNAEDTKL